MLPRVLMWFRRDLRLHENPALTAAMDKGREVIPVFVFDRPLLDSGLFGSACVTFMLECLHQLRAALAGQGLALRWTIGDPCEEIPKLARDLGVDAVYWNRDYEPGALLRDRTVEAALGANGIVLRTFADHLICEPEELRTGSGQPFQRFSAFRAAWWKRWWATAPSVRTGGRSRLGTQTIAGAARKTVVPPARSSGLSSALAPPLPDATELGYEACSLEVRGGEQRAHERLQWFLAGPLHRYQEGRNRPGSDETSILSPHFRFGTLRPRGAVQAALESLAAGGAVSRVDVHAWVDELIWREFFYHVMAGFPHVLEGPFRPTASVAPPRPDGPRARELFSAWCEGRTGYPLVDAGMRQLTCMGWMHNRVRMVVASFLVKDLRLDWRWGERYFMQCLLDADAAVNNGNWQWCASTGTDAMPGYRIFNPVLQARKFDPDGEYIRRYVPELASVPVKYVHDPSAMSLDWQERSRCRLGIDYPRPIVDHAHARQEYLASVEGGRVAAHGL